MKQEMLFQTEPDSYRQVTASQLQEEFMAVTPAEMDRMPDEEILQKFGLVKIIPEPVEPTAAPSQAAVEGNTAAEAVVEDARKNVSNALSNATAEPEAVVGKSDASISDMRKFASAKAKQLRQENPEFSIADANDLAVAYTKRHFGITEPETGSPENPQAVVKAQKTEVMAHGPAPGSLAAIVRENVQKNRAATGYVSDYERNLLRLTRNRTEAFRPMQPEVYDRFSDEQLNQIKSNLLDSLATESLRLEQQKLGEQRDLSGRVEEITQNLITLQLQLQRRQNTSTSANETDVRTMIQLSDGDIDRVVDAIPPNSDSLLPIYEEYNRMNALFSVARDPREAQAIGSRMNILREVAMKLMLRKAKGWDNVKVSELRRILAHDHPNLAA